MPNSAAVSGSVSQDGRASVAIRVEDLRKEFVRAGGDRVPAIDGITLTVPAGEMLVLLGPSGCGKSTLLRSVAGLEAPDSGRIELDGTVVYDSGTRVNRPPNKRPANMVFQSYALWPHMTIQQNLAFPLKRQGWRRDQVRKQVQRIAEIVGIAELLDQTPSDISGGQQQRAALARALSSGSNVILFDEPLSNVDAKVRERLRTEIKLMQFELGFTAMYVTHDQEEAMVLADRIALLETGRVAQIGAPEDLYVNPASLYVADFVGAANKIEIEVNTIQGHLVIGTDRGGARWTATAHPTLDRRATRAVVMGRPEFFQVAATPTEGLASVAGTVVSRAFMPGSRIEHVVRVGSTSITASCAARSGATRGDVDESVHLVFDPADVTAFPARTTA